VALCQSCVNQRFGGTYRLHLQGRKIRERGTSVIRWLQTEPSVGFQRIKRPDYVNRNITLQEDDCLSITTCRIYFIWINPCKVHNFSYVCTKNNLPRRRNYFNAGYSRNRNERINFSSPYHLFALELAFVHGVYKYNPFLPHNLRVSFTEISIDTYRTDLDKINTSLY
jgi:hypothetical protein